MDYKNEISDSAVKLSSTFLAIYHRKLLTIGAKPTIFFPLLDNSAPRESLAHLRILLSPLLSWECNFQISGGRQAKIAGGVASPLAGRETDNGIEGLIMLLVLYKWDLMRKRPKKVPK